MQGSCNCSAFITNPNSSATHAISRGLCLPCYATEQAFLEPVFHQVQIRIHQLHQQHVRYLLPRSPISKHSWPNRKPLLRIWSEGIGNKGYRMSKARFTF